MSFVKQNRMALDDKRFYTSDIPDNRRTRAILLQCAITSHKDHKLSKQQHQDLVWNIENSCYESACAFAIDRQIPIDWDNPLFNQIYGHLCFTIQSNLLYDNTEGSKYLINKLLENGNEYAKRVASLNTYELKPVVTQSIRDTIDLRNRQKIKKTVHYTITCPRCGKNETTTSESQTRAGDEASTIMVQCVSEGCTYRWKLN